MKSGDDFCRLRSEFNQVQRRYRQNGTPGFVSPVQRLRDMIPHTNTLESTKNLSADRCDPALIRRDEDPNRWNDFLAEAQEVMPQFNRSLRDAIEQDKAASKFIGLNSPPH